MSNPVIELEAFALDELGRVVLSEEMIDRIDCCQTMISAGANISCTGSSNGSCTNSSYCSDSTNSWCTNSFTCTNSINSWSCS